MNITNIKNLRLNAKLTQTELAELLGIDQTTVNKWEMGKSSPNIAKLPQLAKVLHCEIGDILTEE